MINKIALSELTLNITDGKHGDCVNEENSGYYFLSVKDIKRDKIDFENARQITEVDFTETHKRTKLEEGDILLANSGHTIGKMFYVVDCPQISKTTFQKSVAIIKADVTKVTGNYLYYALLASVSGLRRAAVGSAQPNLLLRDLRNFKVPIHKSRKQQNSVSRIMSTLDKKIELNNKINTELEAMAKLIYDYWFVQFDFPDENGKPFKSSGGKMVYNEELKREIPHDWVLSTIGKHAHVKKGELITKKTVKVGKVKVIAAGLNAAYFHSTPNYANNTITISGSGASAGYINFWREAIFASDCITVRGNSDAETLLVLHYLKLIQDYIFKQARGSAQPHVYPNDIAILSYVIPPDRLVELFSEKVMSANKKIAINQKESESLIELRDWILPMLMNGQVTIKDN